VARESTVGLDDAAFWYATAEKLIAPLLFAAAQGGLCIGDVVRWVDTEEVDEVLAILDRAGVPEAVRAAEASFGREERQRSSIYTTAETVLSAFADPDLAAAAADGRLDPAALVAGGSDTLYLVAPTHEQARLRSVFVAIVRLALEAAFTASSRAGRPLDPPLLVVLDEAANIAPLADLDAVASTAASHGVQLVTVFQDLAQLEGRYGARAATVVNNHRAKVICSAISDPATLERFSALIGEEERPVDSTSIEATGAVTRGTTTAPRRLAAPDWLRRLSPGEALVVYAHLPPVIVALRPFFADAVLALRAGVAAGAASRQRVRRVTSRLMAASGRVVDDGCEEGTEGDGADGRGEDQPA
jgi:type IV secretion system protein VirD4